MTEEGRVFSPHAVARRSDEVDNVFVAESFHGGFVDAGDGVACGQRRRQKSGVKNKQSHSPLWICGRVLASFTRLTLLLLFAFSGL